MAHTLQIKMSQESTDGYGVDDGDDESGDYDDDAVRELCCRC